MRKAVLQLVEEGYLIRQQGKGTFVQRPKIKRELITVNGYSEYMIASGKIPHIKLISLELCKSTEEISQKLGISPETKIYVLKRVYYDEGEPLTLDIAHYSSELFPNLPDYIDDSTSMHGVLRNKFHINPFRSTKLINVITASGEEAEHLECNIGDPIYEIQKTAFDDCSNPIYHSTLFMPAERVTFSIDTPFSR